MDLTGLEHEINGTTPMPKCNDLYTLLGAVNVKDYKCPNCGKLNNDEYEVKSNIPNVLMKAKAIRWMEPIGIGKRFIVCEDCEILV
jgi:ssDNA-binding Zn-finger/Zn-ribbon topoisomerase 1